MAIPESITQKLRWAEHHFHALRAERDRHFNDPSNYVMADTTGHANAVFRARVHWHFSQIVGDCLQSLRSVLDYLAGELCIRAGTDPTEQTAFPLCKSEPSFNKSRRGRLQGMTIPMVAEIERLQPYKCPQGWDRSYLGILNELCNSSKHRGVLLTEISVRNLDPTMETAPIAHTATYAGEMEMNDKIVASIAFDEGPLKGEDACRCIRLFIEDIENRILPAFEKFF